MATSQEPQPEERNFPRWMAFSRLAQVLFAIAILGLDCGVIDGWNQNRYDPGFLIETKSGIKTYIGDTPFTGLVLFTVSSLPGFRSLCSLFGQQQSLITLTIIA